MRRLRHFPELLRFLLDKFSLFAAFLCLVKPIFCHQVIVKVFVASFQALRDVAWLLILKTLPAFLHKESLLLCMALIIQVLDSLVNAV